MKWFHGLLLSQKKERYNAIYSNIDRPRDHHIKSEKNISYERIRD